MARIFNISFSYNDVTYTAMITSISSPFFTEYHINMLDDEIMKQLPCNKIVATEPEEFKFLNVSHKHNDDLMNEIIKAVKERLQTVHV